MWIMDIRFNWTCMPFLNYQKIMPNRQKKKNKKSQTNHEIGSAQIKYIAVEVHKPPSSNASDMYFCEAISL